MKQFLITAVLASSLFGMAQAQNAADTIMDVQKAVSAMEENYCDSAEIFMSRALAQRQTYRRFLFMGEILMKKQEYSKAVSALRMAEKNFQNCALLPLAECYAMIGNTDSAFYFLEKYSQKNDKLSLQRISDDTLLFNLKHLEKWTTWAKKTTYSQLENDIFSAEHYVNAERTGQALEILDKIIKKYPSCHKAYYLRAKAYVSDQNYKSALQDILRAVKLRPKQTEYLENQANIYFLSQKYALAAQTYVSVLKIDEFAIKNYYNAAKNFYLSSNYVAAIKYASMATQLYPNDEDCILLYSEVLLATGDAISALKVINQAGIEKKSPAQFYRLRGLCYLKTETYNFAISDFCNAIDLNNSLTDIYLHRGMAYYLMGEKDLAHKDWQTALKFKHFQANNYLQKYR